MKKITLLPFLIVLLMLTAACAPQQAAMLEELPRTMNADQVREVMDREDVTIIDVREDWEYAEGHIPGAELIPLGQLPDRIGEVSKEVEIILVCRSGNRSGQALQFLEQQGFENAHNMNGGMIAWTSAGHPTE
jgi:rhodanese-related sulfurtransferase